MEAESPLKGGETIISADERNEVAKELPPSSNMAAKPSSRGQWPSTPSRRPLTYSRKVLHVLRTYCKFIGPGFMVSVAYIDPGNYATDVAAGASFRFKLLAMILISNIFAVFLQSLCIHLGTVTGLNLAQMIRKHYPPWLNYLLYLIAQCAIIATDMAEVIGTAIALNLLSNGKIPLVAGCAISIADVLFILLFYKPTGATKKARAFFEGTVALLVLGVVICFSILLSYIGTRHHITIGEVFHGYVPSSALVKGKGLYESCGILGATVMPHSLYLGSGLVQDRLKDFDKENNTSTPDTAPSCSSAAAASAAAPAAAATVSSSEDGSKEEQIHQPSLKAIRTCMGYSIAELTISLTIFAFYINSAITIVAGSALHGIPGADNAGLQGIYRLLSRTLNVAVGKIFAVALLLSGTSAGIICTMAGQMVCEGQLKFALKPWQQRFLTRSVSITPSIIIAGALGEEGLNRALVGSQVALSVILPIVSAPLLYFTCVGKYMTARGENGEGVNMRVHVVTAVFAVLIWLVLLIMNFALIVLLGLGKT